jgi:DNA modification methylase
MGSGTTAVACIGVNRKYIGFEKDPTYFQVCTERIQEII